MISIDVVIPCYYAPEIIQPCFEKLAIQTYKNFRVIMINDCSPFTDDEYKGIREQYKDRLNLEYYKTETNSGPGVVRQMGLDMATADFIIFIDDDDELYDETTLQRFIDAVDGKDIDKILVVSGKSKHTWDDGRSEIINPNYHHQATMYNLSLIKKHNMRYETDISFKEEDGAFSSLLFVYAVKYGYIEVHPEGIMYIKKWSHNHVSLCARVSIIDSFINFIINKICFLIYLKELEVKMDSNHIDEVIIIVPITLNNLCRYLQSERKTINEEQYRKIAGYIYKYIDIIKDFNIDLKEVLSNNKFVLEWLQKFFDGNSFYGKVHPEDIENFMENYQLILYKLKNYIQ